MINNEKNIPFISVILSGFQLDILGKDNNDEQLPNILPILVSLFIFQFDKSGKEDSDEQL